MPRTTIVTVLYNSADTIGPLLESLRPAHAAGAIDIVLVDNQSRDATLETVADFEREGLVRLVHAGANIGFGRGCNLGAAHAAHASMRPAGQPAPDFIVFLNPDARLDADAIATLEQALDANPGAAIAAPAIERPDHTLQPVGMLPTRRSLILERTPLHSLVVRAQRPTPDADPSPTTWVSGAAFMVRREAFERVGGFDPRFFLYFEESDLFRRLARAGHTILICPRARCPHIGGHSTESVESGRISGSIAEHFIRSRNEYARKHFGSLVMALADLAFAATLWCRATFTRNPQSRATWQARRTCGLFRLPEPVPPQPASTTAASATSHSTHATAA
ncbi:MAG: glycosyltransferase family 2 protein [Phycisphaerales bacterium]|nr:glycosyltransferase family 2 protein [Phycisphaerales bacterium]